MPNEQGADCQLNANFSCTNFLIEIGVKVQGNTLFVIIFSTLP